MNKPTRGFASVVVLLIALLAIAGTVGYVTIKNNPLSNGPGEKGLVPKTAATSTEQATFAQNTASVPSMSKYVEKDFGFSFWYPSSWVVDSPVTNPAMANKIEDCTFKKMYTVHGSKRSDSASIAEYFCPDLSMTLRGAGASPVGVDIRYYFDTVKHTWMVSDLSDPPNGSPRKTGPANVSYNTMGGLHMFPGVARFGADVVVPLSARNFLLIATNDGGGYVDERLLARTIVALDPSVGTPDNDEEQAYAIEVERDSYTAGNLSATPLSGKAPLTVTFDLPASAGDESINFGDGKFATTACPDGPHDFCVTTFNAAGGIHVVHTYTAAGTYMALGSRHLPSTVLGRVEITVQ